MPAAVAMHTPHQMYNSYGICIWEVLAGANGNRPWAGLSVAEVMGNVVLRSERPQLPDNFSELNCDAPTVLSCAELMQRCLEQEPDDRPAFDEIVEVLLSDQHLL
jgi:Protein tyrosine and serine/threonine kinase